MIHLAYDISFYCQSANSRIGRETFDDAMSLSFVQPRQVVLPKRASELCQLVAYEISIISISTRSAIFDAEGASHVRCEWLGGAVCR